MLELFAGAAILMAGVILGAAIAMIKVGDEDEE